MSKRLSVRKLVLHRETLRHLSAASLAQVGGGASGTCENNSLGFLCEDLCGNSRSCGPINNADGGDGGDDWGGGD